MVEVSLMYTTQGHKLCFSYTDYESSENDRGICLVGLLRVAGYELKHVTSCLRPKALIFLV